MEKNENSSVNIMLAQFYYYDAREFSQRFDFMWERHTSKTGRTKSFVDLVMGCESALKAHILLGLKDTDPRTAYKSCRNAKHNIANLADSAKYCSDRASYDFLKSSLGSFKIDLRYSLDTYGTFFPLFQQSEDSILDFSHTIGDTQWVSEIRSCLEALLEAVRPEFTGPVEFDFSETLSIEKIFTEILKAKK